MTCLLKVCNPKTCIVVGVVSPDGVPGDCVVCFTIYLTTCPGTRIPEDKYDN